MSELAARIATRAVMVVAATAVLLPLLVIIVTSLKPADSLTTGLSWPTHPNWHNYRDAWSSAGFSKLMRASGLVALGVVPVGLVLATLAGYAFSIMEFRFKSLSFAILMAGLAVPYEAIVIPLYYDLKGMGLTNTYFAVILPLVGAFMPFGAFWMRNQFTGIPEGITEAARLDGASSWTILWRILLPNSRPALATLAVLYFMWTWNQFLLVLIMIQDPGRQTAPLGLALFVGQYTTNLPLLSAGTVIVIAPVLIVYALFQRQFTNGLTQGALKG